MTKVTYYFGAGASYGALPIVNQIPERIENLISLMKRDEYKLNSEISYKENNIAQFSQLGIQELFIEDLEWLLEKTKNHASIDTFAKKLFITEQDDELKRLKNAFSVFLILEQSITKTNMRYDSFFASILNDDYHPLPNNIKIVSWNYDYQFEKAYSEYSRNETLSHNQGVLGSSPSGTTPKSNYSNVVAFFIWLIHGFCGEICQMFKPRFKPTKQCKRL